LIDVDPRAGPPLKHFPFYDDASVINDALRAFMTAFARSYYASDAVVAADNEIQAWVAECNGAAGVLGFPARISGVGTLVDVLTQMVCFPYLSTYLPRNSPRPKYLSLLFFFFSSSSPSSVPTYLIIYLTSVKSQAHLVSAAHHTVNTNELLQVTSTLPFSPPALYKPVPTQKNDPALNVADFLPPLPKVMEQLVVGALFARPLFRGSANRTLLHMFDGDPGSTMLARTNAATSAANDVFVETMRNLSARVASRDFGPDGLSRGQGMPFVWQALDPNVAPFSVAT